MSNRLKNELSPYLRQHAEQRIDWYPWGEEAFEKARREDKPIFLSIGYSTCHWCHVMSEESFENAAVADILNRYFVSVKVDREERPDVDSVYMRVCTLLNGSGGWPLTVLMTGEQTPFFVGTYIPRDSTEKSAGLLDLLRFIADKWRTGRLELMKTGQEIAQYVRREYPDGGEIDLSLADEAARQFADSEDKEYGGFGTSPKFPSPHALLYLVRYAALSGRRSYRTIAENALRQMYRGGIYDHFGGGFARYSTDREWLCPHFEKTLYDNALMAYTCIEMWQDGHMALYRDVAEDTLDYCLRELQDENGGFYCGQDADSDGGEGEYYLFTPEQVCAVLGEDDGRHFAQCYDITPEGNFRGKSIPNLLLNSKWALLPEGYAQFREKMRLYREENRRLFTDKKQLTAWNGLMLMALAKAAWVFSDKRYLDRARALAGFLASMGDGRELKARCCQGEKRFMAQLDDYVFYALGLLELYRADPDPAYILRAEEMARQVTERFADGHGGFYRTACDHEKLLFRPVESFDGAMPSGSSGAAVLLDQLWRFTGKTEYRTARDGLLGRLCKNAGKYPAGCAFALIALLGEKFGTRDVVCAAPDGDPARLRPLTARYDPTLTVLFKTPDNGEALRRAAPFTADCTPKENKARYYICRDGVCGLPVEEQ